MEISSEDCSSLKSESVKKSALKEGMHNAKLGDATPCYKRKMSRAAIFSAQLKKEMRIPTFEGCWSVDCSLAKFSSVG